MRKLLAHFLKIGIQIHQKICSLAAKEMARTKAMTIAKSEVKVFKDFYSIAFRLFFSIKLNCDAVRFKNWLQQIDVS